jgi:very-short-patch-repair endonuclease
MPNKGDMPDFEIARIAAVQHGIVTARQLAGAGLGRSAISERTRGGRLHRVHQGVYAVGHRAFSLHRRWMAAVLAGGEGAVLSHGSAAALWGLLRPIDGPVHVSVPTTAGLRCRRGIHLHRCTSLAEPSSSASHLQSGGGRGRRLLTTRRDRIPVTTVPRTIHDLRGCLPSYLVRRAIRQAELAGHRLEGIEGDRTRSDLERDFLALCRRFGLPKPEVNAKVGRWEVDFLWRSRGLAVEADTFTYHRGSVAFEDDHACDFDLRARGYAIRRYTDSQIDNEPERVAADVAAALRARSAVSGNPRG